MESEEELFARTLLAQNIKACMVYASDNPGLGLPSSQRALAKATGLSRHAIQYMLDESRSAGLDKIAAVARVYKLQPWQLLFPGLDLRNRPVVPQTETERELYRRLQEVQRRFATIVQDNSAYHIEGNQGSPSDGDSDSEIAERGPQRPEPHRRR